VYTRPAELDEALALLAEPGSRVLAGGTDIFPAIGDKPLRGRHVDVTAIAALHGVSVSKSEIRIGGAVTWTDLVRAELPPAFDALKVAAREVGGLQIQNRGTIAGNLCNASPAADGVPPLLILDAEVEIASMRGLRRLPLSQFILGNRRTALASDEILTAIVAPAPSQTMRSAFLKLGARRYLVISIVMVAALLDVADGAVRDARVAVGACSAAAMRLPAVERRLVGAPAHAGLSERVKGEDIAALAPIDDLRATGLYRRDAALSLIRRAIESCLAGQVGGVL
jgi:CO/xanthine dehydrogenase FAD-binding subunit